MTPRPRVLHLAYSLLLGVVAALSAHTHRHILWQAAWHPAVFVEFRGVVLFLPDYVLLLALLASALRALLEPPFRARLFDTFTAILFRHGGTFWVGFILWIALSLRWAGSGALARYETLYTAAALLLALLMADLVRAGQQGPALLLPLVIAAAIQAVIAAGQLARGGPLGLAAWGEIRWVHHAALYRGSGLAVNPNNLAGYLVIAAAAWLALVVSCRRHTARLILWPMGAAVVAGLVATLSRSAVLAVLSALIVLIFLRLRPRTGTARAAGLVLAALATLVAVGWIGLRVAGVEDRLLERREFYLDYTRTVIERHPWTGAGAGNLLLVISRQPNTVGNYQPVHNAYLMIAGELGLPGLLLFGLACAAAVAPALARRSRDNLHCLIWGTAWLVVVIIMLFDYYFWGDHRSRLLLFWLLGLLWGQTLAPLPPGRPDRWKAAEGYLLP